MAISSKQVYSQVPKSLSCEKYLASIQPSSGNSFVVGEQVEFVIPTRGNEFLNAVNTTLRFRVNAVALATPSDAKFDNNASNMIERVEVYHGSNLLEQLSGYGVLFTTMFEAQTISLPVATSISYGTTPDLPDADRREGATIPTGAGITVEMPLLSSVVGLASNPYKYLPLCKMTAGPLRVVITLRDGRHQTAATINPIGTFNDMSLNCEFIKVGQQAMSVIDKANEAIYGSKDTVQVNTKQWSDYIYQIPNGTTAGTSLSNLVDARYSSVCGLVFSFLNNGVLNGGSIYLNSTRNMPYSSMQLRIGSTYFPRKPIVSSATNKVEAFTISQRYLGSLNDPHNFGGIKKADYEAVPGVATGGFYLMIDTETYNKENLLYDGINTLNDNIFVDGVCLSTLGSTMIVHAHVQYDTILTCQNGVMTRTM
jgi:hypothetical protein